MKIIRKLMIVVVACSFAASTITHAGTPKSGAAPAKSAASAYVVVSREADFGTNEDLRLFIDGVEVANLPFNRRYEGTLTPGEHVLSISTTPRKNGPELNNRRLNAKPGKTYSFTAVWTDPDSASLNESPGT
jgi:hypothetical protein